MHTHNLIVNDSNNWHAVEGIAECLPHLDAVSSLALIIESVESVDAGALVISSKKEEILWVLNFVGKEQADGLYALFSSINIISQEEIIALRRVPSELKEPQQVIVLSMDITADLDWSSKFKEDGLLDKNLTGLICEGKDVVLWEVDLLARLLVLDLKELGDGLINVDVSFTDHCELVIWGCSEERREVKKI